MTKEEVKEFLKNSDNIKESILYLLDNTLDIEDIRSELLEYSKVLMELKSELDNDPDMVKIRRNHLSCGEFKRTYNKQRS